MASSSSQYKGNLEAVIFFSFSVSLYVDFWMKYVCVFSMFRGLTTCLFSAQVMSAK